MTCKVSIVDSSVKVRLFETKNWKDYQDDEGFKPMLAYHMSKIKKNNDKISSASFLIKNSEMKIKWSSVLIYVAITLLLGVGGSFIANKLSSNNNVETADVVEASQDE